MSESGWQPSIPYLCSRIVEAQDKPDEQQIAFNNAANRVTSALEFLTLCGKRKILDTTLKTEADLRLVALAERLNGEQSFTKETWEEIQERVPKKTPLWELAQSQLEQKP